MYGMIVGYSYNGDTYCADCVHNMRGTVAWMKWNHLNLDINRIPRDLMDNKERQVVPVFDWSEWDYQPTCGGCYDELKRVSVICYCPSDCNAREGEHYNGVDRSPIWDVEASDLSTMDWLD